MRTRRGGLVCWCLAAALLLICAAPGTASAAVPTCDDLAVETTHGEPAFLGVVCQDADGDALTYSVAAPGHGTAEVDAFGVITYTPEDDFTGTDSFTYRADDGETESDPATITVTVTNSAPVCFADEELTLRTGKPAKVSIFCSDGEGDDMTISASPAPAHGTLGAFSTDNGFTFSASYTPDPGYTGADAFTLRASDGVLSSDPEPFALTITANHAPSCEDALWHGNVATTLRIYLFCSDHDLQDQEDGLDYSAVAGSGPAHGTLAFGVDVSGFEYVDYTPVAGFVGEDAFTLRASDGALSDTARMRLHVADTPLCTTPAPIVVRSGRSRVLTPECTQPPDDNTGLTLAITSFPTRGALLGGGFSRVYAADAGASGADSVAYKVTSGAGESPVVTQAITVGPNANNAPVCDADGFADTVYAGRPWPVFINCSDLDGDQVTFATRGQPAHGSASASNGQLTYTGDAGYAGPDSVPFTATDGHGAAVEGSWPVEVAPPEVPDCIDGPIEVTVRPGRTVSLPLFCFNPQGDPQTFSTPTPPSKGTLGPFGPIGSVDYTAADGPNGTDTFTLRASNAVGNSALVPVTVTIDQAYNRAPICFDNFFPARKVARDVATALDLTTVCTDPDDDPIAFSRASQPESGGTVSDGPTATLTYTPPPGFLGQDSFSFFATDSRGVTSETTTHRLDVVESLAPTCTAPAPLSLRPGQSRSLFMSCTNPAGGPITYKIVSGPASGTLSPSGDSSSPSRFYTAPGSEGDGTFTFRASGSGGDSALYTQTITVTNSANQLPSCQPNDGFPQRVVRGRATTLSIAARCNDPDGDPLTFTRVAPNPQHGSTTVAGNAITYTSDAAYVGTDSIGYSASDGRSAVEQTFTVTVEVPVAPTCETPAAVSVRPNRTVGLEFDCEDTFGAPLTYDILTPPTRGTLDPAGDGPDPVRDYHAGGTAGADSFTYRATSENGDSNTVTQAITVSATANTDSDCFSNSGFPEAAATEVPRTLEPFCFDEEEDALTYTKLTNPAHGTVSDAGGSLVYTSAAGYTGPDQFTYLATDALGGTSAPTTMFVNVVAAQPPSCPARGAASVRPTRTRVLDLTCTDALGDPLTYVIDTPPAKGTLGGSGAIRFYTAGAETGSDSFIFHAHSPTLGDSAPQTQAIDITSTANTAPNCPASTSFTAKPGQARVIAPPCSDGEGDALTFSTVSGPSHGTLEVTPAGVFSYTATAGYAGPDSFTYRATDALGAQSAVSTAAINVSNANNAPQCDAGPFNYTTQAGIPINFPPAPCIDPDGDALTYTIVGPSHGTLTAGQAGTSTYTPTAGYTGPDSFTFRASDGLLESGTGTVNITVQAPANQAPVCQPVTKRVAPGGAATVNLVCSDPNGDPITIEKVADPGHGTLGAIDQGTDSVVYTPAAGFTGADSFTYRASDGTATGATATVTLEVTRAPTCDAVSRRTPVGVAVAVPLSCTDADGDALTLSKASDPAHGTVGAITAGSITYTPTAGYFGPDSFTYRASDGTAQSAPATVSITVTRAPACDAASRRTPVGVAVAVPLSCTDADGDALTLSKVSDPAHGSVGAITAGSITYTPEAGYFGADSFTYRASDGTAQSAPATVSLTVTRAPACSDVSASTPSETPVEVTLACTDADGDALTLAKVTDPAHGALGAVAGGKVTYTPAADFKGADSFTYRASDGTAQSAPATVTITVTNRAPTCAAKSAETAFETPVAVELSCTDPEGDAVTLEIAGGPAHGALGAITAGKVTYSPAAGYSGADSFTYRAGDGTESSAPATVSLTVKPKPVDPGTGGGGGGGNTGGGGTTGGGGGGTPADTKAPAATAALVAGQKLKAALAKGLKLALTLDEAGTVTITLTVDKATARKLKLDPKAKKAVVVGTLTKTVGAGKSAVTVKFTAKARKALKKAKSVKLGIAVAAKDAAGNIGRKTGSATLKR